MSLNRRSDLWIAAVIFFFFPIRLLDVLKQIHIQGTSLSRDQFILGRQSLLQFCVIVIILLGFLINFLLVLYWVRHDGSDKLILSKFSLRHHNCVLLYNLQRPLDQHLTLLIVLPPEYDQFILLILHSDFKHRGVIHVPLWRAISACLFVIRNLGAGIAVLIRGLKLILSWFGRLDCNVFKVPDKDVSETQLLNCSLILEDLLAKFILHLFLLDHLSFFRTWGVLEHFLVKDVHLIELQISRVISFGKSLDHVFKVPVHHYSLVGVCHELQNLLLKPILHRVVFPVLFLQFKTCLLKLLLSIIDSINFFRWNQDYRITGAREKLLDLVFESYAFDVADLALLNLLFYGLHENRLLLYQGLLHRRLIDVGKILNFFFFFFIDDLIRFTFDLIEKSVYHKLMDDDLEQSQHVVVLNRFHAKSDEREEFYHVPEVGHNHWYLVDFLALAMTLHQVQTDQHHEIFVEVKFKLVEIILLNRFGFDLNFETFWGSKVN